MLVPCVSPNGIKAAILSGKIAFAERNTGKTTILMEVIHEKHRGDAMVVFPDITRAEHFRKIYASRYCRRNFWQTVGDLILRRNADFIPTCRSIQQAGALRGEAVYVDGWSSIPGDLKERIAPAIVGGVC